MGGEKRMKHRIMIMLLFIFVLILAACNDQSSNGEETSTESSSSSDSKELVVADYGGTSSEAAMEAWYKPFEEEYGVKVTVVPNDIGKLKAMVESDSVEWDVVINETAVALNLAKEELLAEIDYDVVDTTDMDPEVYSEYTLGAQFSYTAIAYNTNIYANDDHPKSWQEFWDVEKYQGGRSLWNFPYTLEVALLADGVAKEDMYPLDLDRAFASLEKIRDDVKVWWDSGAQPVQLLTTEEVPVLGSWNGRITKGKEDGAPVNIEFNDAITALDSWFIPKGAPNEELAQQFLDFVTEAERQAEYAKIIHYVPTNNKAREFLTEEERQMLGLEEDNIHFSDHHYWAENFDEINERFNEWMLE